MLHWILTISFLLTGQTADRPLQDWLDFSPRAGGFTVKMPGVPKAKTQTVETPHGAVKITSYGIERERMAFMIMISELPRDALKRNAKDVLDEARDKGVQNSRGTLREEKEHRTQGRECQVTSRRRRSVRSWKPTAAAHASNETPVTQIPSNSPGGR